MLLSFNSAAQEVRVLFKSHRELSYRKGARHAEDVPIQVVEHLLVFKDREVRYNDRAVREDTVYPIVLIDSRKHGRVYTYDCGTRTYQLDFKHSQVELYDHQTGVTTVYYGDIVPYEVKPR